MPTLMTTTSTRRLKLLDAPCNHVRRHAATSHAHLCPDRGTPERSCTPARVSNATLALMHHSPHPFCPAGPSSAPPARACTCALLNPPPHITENLIQRSQAQHQAISGDLLGCSSPSRVWTNSHTPSDTAGGAVRGDPGLRRAETRRTGRNLEVHSDTERPMTTVYWGWETVSLIVCHA